MITKNTHAEIDQAAALGWSSAFILGVLYDNRDRITSLLSRVCAKTEQMLGSPPSEPADVDRAEVAAEINQPLDGVVGKMARIAVAESEALSLFEQVVTRLEQEL